jgi:hypothetical protein
VGYFEDTRETGKNWRWNDERLEGMNGFWEGRVREVGTNGWIFRRGGLLEDLWNRGDIFVGFFGIERGFYSTEEVLLGGNLRVGFTTEGVCFSTEIGKER